MKPEKYIIKREVITKTISVVEQEVSCEMYIAEKVKQLRKKTNFTQAECAKIVGVSRVTLNNIENGRQGLKMKVLNSLCFAFNVKSADILPF